MLSITNAADSAPEHRKSRIAKAIETAAGSCEGARKTRPRVREPQPIEAVNLPDALLKKATVCAVVGLSGSTIDRKTASGEFPASIKLGARCTRWRSGDVRKWLAAQVAG